MGSSPINTQFEDEKSLFFLRILTTQEIILNKKTIEKERLEVPIIIDSIRVSKGGGKREKKLHTRSEGLDVTTISVNVRGKEREEEATHTL